MDKLCLALVLPAFASLLGGCIDGAGGEALPGAEPELDLSPQAVDVNGFGANGFGANGFGANGFGANGLNADALTPRELGLTPLSFGGLSTKARSAIQDPDGGLARDLVRYAVRCAYQETQVFTFSWLDANGVTHNEAYTGSLGLAPGWSQAPLAGNVDQRMVSACLAALVNYYGVHVVVSLRSASGPLKTHAQDDEVTDYPHIEGVFWGNLFGASPYLNACGEMDNAAISRAAQRDCAVGHLEGGQTAPCGMITLAGSCADVCMGFDDGGQYYHVCVDRPASTSLMLTTKVITTALP